MKLSDGSVFYTANIDNPNFQRYENLETRILGPG